MGMNDVFILGSGNTGSLSVSTVSASLDFSSLKSGNLDRIRLATDVDAYVRVTAGASAATTSDLKLLAGSVEEFAIAPDATHLSGILSSGTGTINVAIF